MADKSDSRGTTVPVVSKAQVQAIIDTALKEGEKEGSGNYLYAHPFDAHHVVISLLVPHIEPPVMWIMFDAKQLDYAIEIILKARKKIT